MKAKEFDIKKRDPNWRAMQDIRRSGAGGQHKDKKKAEKQGEVKHKAKQFAEGVSEGSYTTEKQIMTRIRQIMHDRKLSGTESNAGELLRLKQQLKDLRSQQNMAESLDQPYMIKWRKGYFDSVNAIATLEDGTDLYIRFDKISDQLYNRDQWEIDFFRGDRQAITGEGDAQKIFATVLKAIHEFVRKKEPDSIEFSTNKEVDPRGSRTRLYDRLVDRYARDLGYTLQKQEDSSYTTYRLNRKQGVVEGGLREFAPHSGDGSGARWYNDDELADLLGDEWLQDMDVSGNLGHIELAKATTGSTDPAVAWLVDLAQSWLDSQGYHVRVLSARDNEDEGNLDWLIDGVFYRDLDRAKLQQVAQDEHDYYANLYAGLLGQLQDTTWHERAKAWSDIRRALNGGRISLDGVKKKIQDMELEIKKKKGVQEGTGLMPSREYRILEKELDQYQAILKKSREITKSIKYSRVHSEIITEIKMLAEQNKISPEMFDDAISEIFDAASRLESAVYGLEEPIEDRIRNIKNRISELEDEEYYKESNEQQSSCPECGGPLVSESSLSEKQDACYHKVKSRYKVWPSAYASGALVQCRKKGAKNWGKKSKVTEGWRETLAGLAAAGIMALSPGISAADVAADSQQVPMIATIVVGGEVKKLDLTAKGFRDVREAEKFFDEFFGRRGMPWQGKIERGTPGSGQYQRIIVQ